MADTVSSTLARVRGLSLIDGLGLGLLAIVLVFLAKQFVEDPVRFINVSIIGVTNGAIYGVVALGYTLVYGILQLINFAHGDVFALSGLVSSSIIVRLLGLDESTGVIVIVGGMLVTLAITIPVFALLNGSIERVAYKPLRHAPRLAPLITAVGVSFVVQNFSRAAYGVDYESVPNFIPVGQPTPMSATAGSESGKYAGHFALPSRKPYSPPGTTWRMRVGRYHGRPRSHSMSLS